MRLRPQLQIEPEVRDQRLRPQPGAHDHGGGGHALVADPDRAIRIHARDRPEPHLDARGQRVQRPAHPDRSGQLVEDRVLPHPGRQHRQPRADLLGAHRRADEPVHPTHEHEPFVAEQVRVELPLPPLPARARLQRQLPQPRVAVRDAEDPRQSGRLLRADPDRLDHQDGGVAPRKLVGGREPADPGADDDRVPLQARSFSRPGRFHGVIAVLDDDPTGSQTVYGATVVTALDEVADDAADLLPDQHAVAGRGRGRAAHVRRRAAAVRVRPGRRDRQPQRLDVARPRARGGAGDRPRPPRRAGRRVRRRAARTRVLRGRALHARRRALRGRDARGGDGVRAGRHVRVLVLEPRRLRGREGRRRGAQPVAGRRAAPGERRAVGRGQRGVLRRPRRGRACRAGERPRAALPHRAVVRARAGRAGRAAAAVRGAAPGGPRPGRRRLARRA